MNETSACFWNFILISSDAKIKNRGFPILELLDVNYSVPKAPLELSRLIFAEIEGLNSIHKVLSRINLMFLANQIKEILIVI